MGTWGRPVGLVIDHDAVVSCTTTWARRGATD
jgi:hypothetical protein